MMQTRVRNWIVASLAAAALLGCSSQRSATKSPALPPTAVVGERVNPGSGLARPEFLESFAQTFRYRLGHPTGIKISPDGGTVFFLRSGSRSFVQDLYEYDVASGRERVLLTADQILRGENEVLTAEELARRERMRLASRGIAAYDLSPDASRILVPLSGRLFIYERATGAKTELKSGAGFPIDPRFSPDGSKVACVRDGDLYIIDVASGSETRLTTRENENIEHGAAEFVAQEEMDRREGYWWSPDSRWIAYQRTDTGGVERFNIADPVNPEKEPQTWPYPRAGKANAAVTVGVISAAGGPTTWANWDRERYPYLTRVNWPKNAPLTLLVQNRTQTEQVLLSVEPSTGSATTLLTERDNAWLNLHDGPRWLPDGSAFLWMTDASSDERIELRSRDGASRGSVTPSTVYPREILAFDAAASAMWIVAGAPSTAADRSGAIEQHIWKVPLGGGAAQRLTEGGVNSAVISKNGTTMVITSESFERMPRYIVRSTLASEQRELKSVAEQPPFFPNVEFTSVIGSSSGQTFHAAIFRPRDARPGLRYPVILSVYAGPHLQYVTASPRGGLLDQWYADHGFIVVRIDGRGTPGRGRSWERSIKGNLIEIPLDDQVEALRALGTQHPELDLERVGVYGWSFGGYFSAMAAMQRPDVFKAGVAGAPVCDWADYDTFYTERYMGLPQDNAAGYRESNVLTYCKDLGVPLLVVHGTADDNVYFMHSLKMTDALFRAGRHFEFLALPGFTHMVPDPVVTRSLYGRVAEFFVRELRVGADRAAEAR